jgi:prepilin-type N-terminal cleavage/methylation domain-containing protein
MGKSRGFTFIEMIVVIVILSIVGLMVFGYLGSSMASYMIVKERDRIFDEGLMAMERMTREIKDARYDSVSYPITSVANTSVTFTRKHATLQDASTSITFRRSGNVLERVGNVSGTRALAGNVASFDPTIVSGKNVNLSLGLTVAGGGTLVLQSSAAARN